MDAQSVREKIVLRRKKFYSLLKAIIIHVISSYLLFYVENILFIFVIAYFINYSKNSGRSFMGVCLCGYNDVLFDRFLV